MGSPNGQGRVELGFLPFDGHHVHARRRSTLDIPPCPEADDEDVVEGLGEDLAQLVGDVGWFLGGVDVLSVAVLVVYAECRTHHYVMAPHRVPLHVDGHGRETTSPRDGDQLEREDGLLVALQVLVRLGPMDLGDVLRAVLLEPIHRLAGDPMTTADLGEEFVPTETASICLRMTLDSSIVHVVSQPSCWRLYGWSMITPPATKASKVKKK